MNFAPASPQHAASGLIGAGRPLTPTQQVWPCRSCADRSSAVRRPGLSHLCRRGCTAPGSPLCQAAAHALQTALLGWQVMLRSPCAHPGIRR